MIPTRFATGHAAHPDWQVALARALDALLQDARVATAQAAAGREAMPEFTLGFCYLSDRLADATTDIVAELQRRLPGVHWVGTVGIGVVATGAEHFDEPALSLMLAALPRRAFRVFSGIQPLRAEGADFHPYTALVHADGRTPDLQELLPELAARTASGYLFGGLSASRRRSVQIADTVFDGGGLSGVAFAAEVGVVSRVTQGCQPIGPRRVVSRVQDNVVIALDGRGALDCALEDLGLPPDMALEPVAEALANTLVGHIPPACRQGGVIAVKVEHLPAQCPGGIHIVHAFQLQQSHLPLRTDGDDFIGSAALCRGVQPAHLFQKSHAVAPKLQLHFAAHAVGRHDLTCFQILLHCNLPVSRPRPLSRLRRQLSQRESQERFDQALASPFGRGGIAPAMTERASHLSFQISFISSSIFSLVARPRLNAVALPQAVPRRSAKE